MRGRHQLRALGKSELPEQIELDGHTLGRRKLFKHTAFAAVGLYANDVRQVVLKCHRAAPLLGLPLAWLGELMARYEAAVLRQVHDIRGVPRLVGMHGRTGLMHEYIPGQPLTRDTEVDMEFCRELFLLVRRLHERGVAYVDLEKAENILVGEDGLPYLFDFQVAFHVPERFLGSTFPARWLRRQLQKADMYHVRKHFRRLKRQDLSPSQRRRLRRKPWFVELGTALSTPFKKFRRWILGKT